MHLRLDSYVSSAFFKTILGLAGFNTIFISLFSAYSSIECCLVPSSTGEIVLVRFFLGMGHQFSLGTNEIKKGFEDYWDSASLMLSIVSKR